jgi:hypothetical protein
MKTKATEKGKPAKKNECLITNTKCNVMKKNVLLIAVLFFLSVLTGSLSAQKFKVGFKAGASIPSLRDNGSNEISKDYESKVAQNFGFIADIGLSKKLSIKTGLDYNGQGGVRTGIQPISQLPAALAQLKTGKYLYADFNNESTLNYFEIPVMGKIELGNKLKYYLNAGPYLGFLWNAVQKTSGNSALYIDGNGTPLSIPGLTIPKQSFEASKNINKDIRSTNWGLTGGIGFAYGMNKNSIVLDARAAYGLTTIQKDTEVNGSSRTGGIFLTLGYMFSYR